VPFCAVPVRTFFTMTSRARGARRVGLASCFGNAARRSADPSAVQLLPGSWSALTQELSHAGRLLPLLGPPGHGGVGALQTRQPTAPAERRNESAQARALQTLPSSRRSSLEPTEITVKSLRSARLRAHRKYGQDWGLPECTITHGLESRSWHAAIRSGAWSVYSEGKAREC
jgi:hypothetical protein